ncbi:glutathione S-transferase [Marinobacter sp. DSM 26671]|jgi:glutathione S-transferase|uniref:Glutathione S-transferase family protein n=2 Tax=Marinobacter TaxID=2742 RepID=A0A349GM71_9GAMM|nr:MULTISPECIES: glutathione S-transferase family protein [Marinobacter]PTB93306.1 glutathione S-transferase family protein [Marinobacter sp. B9-2]HAS78134.1 glutathione S-transferase family protein [Marinobacter adhaerens]AKV97916.1 glutathione S-transferase [Marinobacter sp. CP1]EHJ06409.1 glutathione S-transferase [Marinobacter manganoxydans MnI7-9]SFE44503.1 glutathione S-transferase [Marinobacter sp. DSM 26671]|tara:strand:- start:476 stop:1072 length:597 start_codon:yes stop_codon:yes gene_type:complete
MKIYGDTQSGNCYKVQLVCQLLNIDHQWIDVDILAGDTKSDDFLKKNPNGKIPLLELDSGETLSESNAIINYLAFGSDLYPNDRLAQARVLQWQFFEQYSHEPFIAVARFINKYLGLPADKADEYAAKQTGGHKALQVMEQQLAETPFLAGEKVTTADISLYAYTHVADEGGFELEAYPAIRAWLDRVAALPNFRPMV